MQSSQDIFFREYFKTILTIIHPVSTIPRKPILRLVPRPAPRPVPQPIATIPKENFGELGLEKLAKYIHDPTILSIECPGPEKQIIINRRGRIQAINLTLTEEEIGTIMKEFSDRTRIPLISGVFKAAHKDLLVTAVISEYLGTRFIIQKMKPKSLPGIPQRARR